MKTRHICINLTIKALTQSALKHEGSSCVTALGETHYGIQPYYARSIWKAKETRLQGSFGWATKQSYSRWFLTEIIRKHKTYGYFYNVLCVSLWVSLGYLKPSQADISFILFQSLVYRDT